ncbi:MAG: 3D domain-containing protein [bacterium]
MAAKANDNVKMQNTWRIILFALTLAVLGCEAPHHELEVTATAYTSSVRETNSQPNIAAWGDRLQPGMKAIAVSRDLLDMGLTHNVEVEIVGLEGRYRILDKMNPRWTRKIDIYMGNDVKAAREWGKQTVIIRWPQIPN